LKTTVEIINRMEDEGVIGKYAIGGAVGATFYLEPLATAVINIFVILPMPSGSSLLSLAQVYDYLTGHGCRVDGESIVIGDRPVQFLSPRNALEEEALAMLWELK